MNIEIKRQKLIDSGITEKTVKTMSEGQIEILYSRIVSEQVPTTTTQTKTVKTTKIPRAAAEKGVSIDGHTVSLQGNEIIMTQTEGR